MNEELTSIHDEGPGYFHIMLNMADDDLDPFEYRLLGHYRRVCGARNIPCTETTRQTADACRMSVGKVSSTRQRLAEAGWIRLSQDGNRLVVTLVDRMPENVRRYAVQSDSSLGEHHASAGIPAYRSPDKRSPHEQDDLPSEKSFTTRTICSPDERSVHQVNDLFTTRTICSPDERSPYIEKQQKQQKPIQEPPTTTSAPARPAATEPAASAGGVGGVVGGVGTEKQISEDDLAFILPEVRKLHLSAEAQRKLLGLGAQTALAIAFAATAHGVRNPGGLAVTLMDNDGPPEADLERAALALELRTLDADELDHHLRRREYARFVEQVSTLAKAHELTLPASPPASAMVPQSPAPAQSGLDETLGNMTVRELFVATLMQFQAQLGETAYRRYVVPAQAVRYDNGMLTVRATTHVAYEWMKKRVMNMQVMLQRLSKRPLQVRLIGPDERIDESELGDVVAAEVAVQPEQGGCEEPGEGQPEGAAEPEHLAEAESAGSAKTAGEQPAPPELDPAARATEAAARRADKGRAGAGECT